MAEVCGLEDRGRVAEWDSEAFQTMRVRGDELMAERAPFTLQTK